MRAETRLLGLTAIRADALGNLALAQAKLGQMCHVPKRLEVLREWHRVLKPGGQMLFTDAR
jgi:SAM-dependent methyltransferase